MIGFSLGFFSFQDLRNVACSKSRRLPYPVENSRDFFDNVVGRLQCITDIICLAFINWIWYLNAKSCELCSLFLKYTFGDSWDIHGMRPTILGYFCPTILMEISNFNFRTPVIKVIFEFFIKFFGNLLKGTGYYWWHVTYHFFFNLNIFDTMCENTPFGAEFLHTFCAGIGPLLLSIVLVLFSFEYLLSLMKWWSLIHVQKKR